MVGYLKSNVEQALDKIGVKARDDNDKLRSAEELTEDVLAFLRRCTPEYAEKILFALDLAAAIDRAAGRVETRYWGV